jgi:hypothetical protein
LKASPPAKPNGSPTPETPERLSPSEIEALRQNSVETAEWMRAKYPGLRIRGGDRQAKPEG